MNFRWVFLSFVSSLLVLGIGAPSWGIQGEQLLNCLVLTHGFIPPEGRERRADVGNRKGESKHFAFLKVHSITSDG